MNNISNYYGKFISKLKVKSVIKVEDNDELKLPQESDALNLNIKQVYKTSKENTSPNSNIKRKIKAERKEQLNNFEQFYSSVKHVKYNTLLDYSQIISDFVQFSPESKIEDYFDYLKFKSGASSSISIDDFVVTGTLIKYANIVKRYLISIHHKNVPNLKFEYFKSPKKRNINQTPKITRLKLLDYYYRILISHRKIEDAVMLHAIYSLGLEPYQLYLLCFEALKEDKTIEMWDHKIRQYLTLKLTDDLYNELLFLRTYYKLKGKLSKKEIRLSLDGTEIEG